MPRGRRRTTFADAVAIARDLPGAEEATSYGTPALKVRGKLFARLKEDGETLVLRTDALERAHLLRAEPTVFFLTDHYRDHPWVLVRLGAISRARLAALLDDAWWRAAPPALRARRPR
ncbi:MAG: MmcQ/YjbR family DNA-binding protein [Gemmatimonadales bacterium]|nr:MmcQ/YjbR family DNA-binding protein [Gemmatimonadales bacterium]